MDRDMVNIISHLYFAGKITDERTKQVLYCYADTSDPLKLSQVVIIRNDEWQLAPGVLGFLKLAESSLNSFPPKDWIFGSPLRDPLSQPLPKPKCFLAMPYGPRWFPTVRDTIEQAVKAAAYDFEIAADVSRPGGIMQQVWQSIRSAEVVVADLTGLNANVMYEVGIAHTLGKQVILITQEQRELPFDVSGMRWLAYSLTNLSVLNKELRKSLDEVRDGLALPKRTD